MHNSTTLFQRLKDFLNSKYRNTLVRQDAIFTTKEMRKEIGQYERLTYWKKYNKNPNYVLHCYLGELHTLGAITRVKHGAYRINGAIPQWFGSFHFKGLGGYLNDESNIYWNSLPQEHKVNPWSNVDSVPQNRIEDALGAWPELEPANGSLESRIAQMEHTIEEQVTDLLRLRSNLSDLKALAKKLTIPKLLHNDVWVTEKWVVDYDGSQYMVTNIDGEWSIKNDTLKQHVLEPSLKATLVKYCESCRDAQENF